MPNSDRALASFQVWFNSLPTYKNTGGLPARGSIAAALVVLEHLKEEYRLDLKAHQAEGRAQIKGLNPRAVQAILAVFGETRPFSGEGGRTNRGGPGDVQKMLDTLGQLRLESLSVDDRNLVLQNMQAFLANKVREYHSRKRLEIAYDATHTTWSAVHDLLKQAEQVGKAGPVAQYLVGAKLQLRFPQITVSNDGYSSADLQSGRSGDFQIKDTVFHVTVSPMPPVYEKCRRNLAGGQRVFLLVPDKCLAAARQMAETLTPGQVAVEPLESFVANNVEELSVFAKDELVSGFRRLLEAYNDRVDAIELDKSLMIEIPPTLA